MTNKKSTKKALLMSALSLLLCMSMLVGTTFAWFTDSVETLNNKIVAGNLDVELYNALPGNLTDVTKVKDGGLFEEITYWEPGVVAYENLTIANEGTLALKYALSVNFDNENTLNGYGLSDKLQVAFVPGGLTDGQSREKVLEAADEVGFNPMASFAQNGKLLPAENDHITEIDKTGIPVETVSYAIVIYWEPSDDDNNWNANNGQETSDKQALHIDLGVNLFATQMVAEDDSFGPDYDEEAEYVIGAGESSVYAGATLDGTVENKGTVELSNGTTINFDGIGLENYGDAKLEDVTVNAGTPGTGGYGYAINSGAGANTVLDNVVVDSKNGAIGATDGAQVTINSGSIAVNSQNTSGRYNIYAVGEGTVVTVNGGEYSFSKTLNQKRAYVYVGAGAKVVINGGTFGAASTRKGYTTGILGDGEVIITGGTFGFDPTNWVAAGYKAMKNGTNWIVVPKSVDVIASDNAALNTAIEGGSDTIMLGSGTYIIPDSAKGKTLTIIGSGDTVIASQDDGGAEGDCDYSFEGATVTFENVTITTSTTYFPGYARMKGIYNNCTINGVYTLYDNSTFNNCTFNVSGDVYNIWTWGAPTAEFNNCTFNSDGKAVLLYGTANTKLIVNGCTFNDNGGVADLKAAIEIGNDYGKSYELIVSNTVVNGYEINDKGISTGTTLWANKNSMGTDKLNVVVDGVDVY